MDDSEVYVNRPPSGQAATIGVFCSKEALFSAGAIIQTPDKAKKVNSLIQCQIRKKRKKREAKRRVNISRT